MKETQKRQPVVVVVGHVDHGKSTLLDAIRKTALVEKEVGGITQRIGAYEVAHKENRITFIDTPGHEAFGNARECASHTADVAILAVAADEGAKPQTIECMRVLTQCAVPFIVALTKTDKPTSDIERAKQSLAEKEIFVEGYGGTIPIAHVSAKTGEGLAELLDLVLLLAGMHEKPCASDTLATGTVIEAERSATKGIFATLIIRNGTLQKGNAVVAGQAYSTLRIFEGADGKPLTEAGCGRVARVGGWSEMVRAGEIFQTYHTKREAEEAARAFSAHAHDKPRAPSVEGNTDSRVDIPLIIRADTAGSIEAIKHEAVRTSSEKASIRIMRAELGNIGEGDLRLAESALGSLIIGFNVGIDAPAKRHAKATGTKLHTFDIIYRLADFLTETVRARTPKEKREEVAGQARVVKIFSEEKNTGIVGGKVLAGEIATGDEFRIIRRGERIGTGKIKELQKQKERVRSAAAPAEFGASVSSSLPLAPSDIIEVVKVVEV